VRVSKMQLLLLALALSLAYGGVCPGCTMTPWQRYTGADNCPDASSPLYPNPSSTPPCILGFLLTDCNNFTGSVHGDYTEYLNACPDFPDIPLDSSLWKSGPANGIPTAVPSELDFGCSSCSVVNSCRMTELNVNFFQTYIYVPLGFPLASVEFNFAFIDDGALVYVMASDPTDDVLGIVQLGANQHTANLAPFWVEGECHRVVVIQIDDCAPGNAVTASDVRINGETLTNVTDFCAPPLVKTE